MTDEPAIKPRTPDQIFHVLSEDFRRRVVKRALKHRSESKALSRQRGAALRRLRVDGYRDASRAPRPKLLQPVLDAIRHHDRDLARAVLNHWVDSHGALRDQAAGHLASRGMPVPEPPDACFDGFWTAEQWRSERQALAAAVDEAVDRDSAGLMLCLLARRFPAPPPLVSPLFRDWLDILQDLRPNAPEWEEADTLIKWMEDIRREKERELIGWCREQIAGLCGSLRERFGEELRYLGIEDTPFANPTEVFDALAWLATAYRNGPTDRIGETCPGWFYKSNQSAPTMGRFPDWYRTRVNGTAWQLASHLGKGTSHDPHHTIRIAFAWDEPNERVIVGFVGLHQRNRAS